MNFYIYIHEESVCNLCCVSVLRFSGLTKRSWEYISQSCTRKRTLGYMLQMCMSVGRFLWAQYIFYPPLIHQPTFGSILFLGSFYEIWRQRGSAIRPRLHCSPLAGLGYHFQAPRSHHFHCFLAMYKIASH